jgi:hypothetical protein
MWFKLYGAGFILVIPTPLIAMVPLKYKLSFSPPGWARKRGKQSGRPISDHSRRNRHGHPLNDKRVKEVVRALYGDIVPVNIEELMGMILEQADRVGWRDLRLWKMDLKGAFNLIFFRPEDAGLLAMELSENLTMISITGTFGHTSTPFAFDVVSRAILADVRKGLKGDARICCDDLMGVCSTTEVVHEMTHARRCIEDLLGSLSVAEDKSECGRKLDFIGWSVDLDDQRLGIARHNTLKVFYGFCELRTRKHLSVREIMKLASWSSRYSLVCRWMRPFSTYLYSLSSGYTNLETQVLLTSNSALIIDLWVMFLVLMEIEPTRFTRSILSFWPDPPSLHVNLDASLTGVGLILSRFTCPWPPPLAGGGSEGPLPLRAGQSEELRTIAVVGYRFSYELAGDSSYQNSVEFIAIVISLLLITSLGFQGESLLVQGDSTTALSWSSRENFKAGRSTAAAICMMQLQQGRETPICETEHTPGATNPSDPLSRGTDPIALGFRGCDVFSIEDNPSLVRLIARMNPSVPVDLQTDLERIWSLNLTDFEVLRSQHGGWMSRHPQTK